MLNKIMVKLRKLMRDEVLQIAFGCFAIVVGTFVVIFMLDAADLPTTMGVVGPDKSREWLGHLVGYVGAAAGAFLGSVATLWSVSLTIERQGRDRKEDNAKDALPLIRVEKDNAPGSCDIQVVISRILDKTNGRTFTNDFSDGGPHIQITNVGMRELYDLQVTPIKNKFFNGSIKKSEIVPVLYKNETLRIRVLMDAKGKEVEEHILFSDGPPLTERVMFRVQFRDCYGNVYYQNFFADLSYDPESLADKYSVFRSSEVEDCKITSAPIRIEKER